MAWAKVSNIKGPTGATGPAGPQGPAGQSTSLYDYRYSTSTTPPPLSGYVEVNNTSGPAVTLLWVHHTTRPGNDATIVLDTIQAGSELFIQEQSDATRYIKFTVSAAPTDRGTYTEIPVTFLSSGGVAVANNDFIFLGIIALGQPGPTGPQGPPGPGVPAGGTAGQTLMKQSATDYDTVWQTAGAALWTDTGTALTPTVATRQVKVSGPTTGDQAQLLLGSRTVKGRISALAAYDQFHFGLNKFWNGSAWVQDDATKASLTSSLASTDIFQVVRTPPAGADVALLTINGGSSPAGDLTINGNNGIKATGTAWINPSDPRLKHDVGAYHRGLADIVQLEPITYRLNSQPDRECFGFDAAAVRDVFPECVSTVRMKLNPADEEDTDVLVFDMHPILVALVNAIKELATAMPLSV